MKSKEEIVAMKFYDSLSDSRLEPEAIGRYFAQMAMVEVYDKFEELVESARQEKRGRVKWLKDVIIGESTMNTSFDNMCAIINDFSETYSFDFRDNVVEFLKVHNLGIPLAIAYHVKWVSDLNDEGRGWVEKTFQALLELFELEDIGWDSLFDMEEAAEFFPESLED